MLTTIYLLGVFFANLIQGITGFAGNVLAMPTSVLALGVSGARESLNILAILSGAFMCVWFRRDINWKKLGRILVLIIPGMVVGIAIYDIYPADGLLAGYALVIALIGIVNLVKKGAFLLPRWALIALVLASGVMQGMFVSGGPLLVVYAVLVLPEKKEFRATLSAVWFTLNSLIFLQSFFFTSSITPEVWGNVAIGIVPLLLGTIIGGRLQNRLNQRVFMKLTYVLLVVSGVVLFAKALI